jgi:ferredoxin
MELKNLEESKHADVRMIVEIDEDACNGCGLCIPNCAEGALKIVDGKAKLVSEIYCDGLGACLGHCPQDALKIIEREALPFDEEAVHEYLKSINQSQVTCPSTRLLDLDNDTSGIVKEESKLKHWPIQLNLVPTKAPRFENADLLIVADCVPVAHPDFHRSLLSGKTMVMGCPKFDDVVNQGKKLMEILKKNDVKSITVAVMEVPCCSGLNRIVDWAIKTSGKEIPMRKLKVGIGGELR